MLESNENQNKNTTPSEQFQNQMSKSYRETQSIFLIHFCVPVVHIFNHNMCSFVIFFPVNNDRREEIIRQGKAFLKTNFP